jgi:hypothetical protein
VLPHLFGRFSKFTANNSSPITRQLTASPRSFPLELSRQVSQGGLAGFFGLSKRFKGRAGHPDGAPILRERAPRCHIAGRSVKAGTAAALITDHEGKAVAARVPYFHVLDGTNDAGELHSHSTAVAILDAHRARAALIVIAPSQINGPNSGRSWGRGGLLCPEAQAQWSDPSTVTFDPGAAFWINPFGLENAAGSLVAYFELMVLIRSAGIAGRATRRPSGR